MAKVFGGPIPGESLTREKGNSTWEQPPQFTRVDQAFKYYVELLEEDDYLEDVLTVLDSGLPLDLFVDSLLLNGEMKGRHFFDMGFLLGPFYMNIFLVWLRLPTLMWLSFNQTLVRTSLKKTSTSLKASLVLLSVTTKRKVN